MPGGDPSVFGPLIDGSDVERVGLAHLEAWMPTTIARAQRAKDPDGTKFTEPVEEIRQYTVRHVAIDKLPEDQIPTILAYSPGQEKAATKNGDGSLEADYMLILVIVASGFDVDEARELSRLYASAVVMATMYDPSLKAGNDGKPFASHIELGQVINYALPRGEENDQFLSAVNVPLTISVPDILNVQLGPLEPLEEPLVEPDPLPHVKEGGGSVEVEMKSRGEQAADRLRRGGFFD